MPRPSSCKSFLVHGILVVSRSGDLEEESYDKKSNPPERQIYEEAPPPIQIRGECTAKQRANNRRKAKEGTEEALYLGTLFQRDSIDNAHNLEARISC